MSVPTINLAEPMPGLETHRDFHLSPLDEVGAMYMLSAVDDPDRLLLLASALVFHPEYTPVLDDATAAELDLKDSSEAAVFLVVHAGETLPESTVNLLAPLVVNTRTGAGKQVVLTGEPYDLKAPLLSPNAT